MDIQNESQDFSKLNSLQTKDITEYLSKDYYNKFKMEQNLYDQSATLSRLSIIDKTSDDFINNTQLKAICCSERLSEEIYKNQILEKQITNLQQQLKLAINHISILQNQMEQKQKDIDLLQKKLEEQINKNENEKKNYSQTQLKIDKQQICLKDQKKSSKIVQKNQFYCYLKNLSKQYAKNNLTNQKSTQSDVSIKRFQNTQVNFTEDYQMKDASISDQRQMLNLLNSKSNSNFNLSGKKFLSPSKFQSCSPQKQNNLKQKLDITITQIQAMQQQYSQILQTK
ncbi:unnamed protein product [Paramecium sonneborni]|uniref:Uncharacterized protein n=1 Tax=Paramecium sonneborni TaxID=65129 RepID=A0A8S1Q743_9CILI|nr:unnamed protein product [Paramecium sonneborni]